MSKRQTMTVKTELYGSSEENPAGIEPATFPHLRDALTEVTLFYGIIQKLKA